MAAASNAASSEMGSAVGGATVAGPRLAGLDPMLGSPLHFDKIWNLEDRWIWILFLLDRKVRHDTTNDANTSASSWVGVGIPPTDGPSMAMSMRSSDSEDNRSSQLLTGQRVGQAMSCVPETTPRQLRGARRYGSQPSSRHHQQHGEALTRQCEWYPRRCPRGLHRARTAPRPEGRRRR